jgi:regulatory protein YycI of two-component signal transduction system YycFG
MNKKGIIFIIGAILLVIIVIVILVNANKKVDVPNVTIENNEAKGDAVVEQIQFKDITKVYESGITTIRANMYNTTDTVKNVTVKIILKDEKGNELKNMIQVVENLLPNKVKVLSTGIAGDYSKVSEIKFEIVK